jgi:hypothetical protein
MRLVSLKLPIALTVMALTLGACAHRGEAPASAGLSEDDDAYCRAGGKVAPGSTEYVACRRDRDAQRANAAASADKKQRDLGQYMLDHPDRPF